MSFRNDFSRRRLSKSAYFMLVAAVACPASAALIATDQFLANQLDPLSPNAAIGEYVAAGTANQFRRNNTVGGGQNPTVAGFTGAWTGNVTGGTQAVAQWTAESGGINAPQTTGYQLAGRARFGGNTASNTVQRRVQRTLSPYTASDRYYFSLTSQVLTGDAADATVPGFVGVGFTNTVADAAFVSGPTLRGLLIGAANDGANTDYVVRHVGSSGVVQTDVIQDNIVQGDETTVVFDRYTLVRVDFNDDPANPSGNSKLTIWHEPSSLTLYSEAAATAAAAPIVLRTFALSSNADITQMTLLGINWSRPASFDEPRLGTTWDEVVVQPNKTWLSDADGNWENAANWARGEVPGGVGSRAAFIDEITAPRTVTLATAKTVGALTFASDLGYTIAGDAGLTIQGSALGGTISVLAGSNAISVPVTVAGSLAVNVEAGASLGVGQLTVSTGVGAVTDGEGDLAVTSLVVNGTMMLDGAATAVGTVQGTGGVTVSSGAVLTVASPAVNGVVVGLGSLTVNGTMSVASHTAEVDRSLVAVGALTVGATGLLELGNSDLVVDYTETSPIASLIAAYVQARLTVNGDVDGLPTYVALAEAGDLGLTEYGGVTLDETTVIGKFTYVGDANLDGQVDALDYERVDLAIGNSGVFGTAQGDLNYDGIVDALDYEQIDLNIGNGVGSPLAGVFVPEPTSIGLAAVAGILAGRRRR